MAVREGFEAHHCSRAGVVSARSSRWPAAVRVGNLTVDGAKLGMLYVLRSEVNCRFGGELELLHVMSVPAGGEIRGYQRPRGKSDAAWTVRQPCYTGDWPEVDAAVAALVGGAVKGFVASARS